MIYLYSVLQGGKSLHMAQDIYWWVKNGHTCMLTLILILDKIKRPKGTIYLYLDNIHITPDLLIKFSKVYFHDHKFKEGD